MPSGNTIFSIMIQKKGGDRKQLKAARLADTFLERGNGNVPEHSMMHSEGVWRGGPIASQKPSQHVTVNYSLEAQHVLAVADFHGHSLKQHFFSRLFLMWVI